MRRWYQQFYVDVADVTPDMTDRFEFEVDTTAANEKWHVEVEENLKRQADEKEGPSRRRDELRATKTRTVEPRRRPALARSMLLLHGAHDDDHRHDTTVAADPGPRHRISPPTGLQRCGRPPSVIASAT